MLLPPYFVKLTPAARDELRILANGRNGTKDPSWTRRRSDVMTDLTVDLIGLKGEWACEQVFGVQFDRSIGVKGDDGYDLTLPLIGKVAIKFNHRPKGYLMFERRRDFAPPVALAILVTGQCDPQRGHCVCGHEVGDEVLRVCGWVFRDDFWQQCLTRDWGLGIRYVMKQPLLPMDGLFDLMTLGRDG